MVLESLTCRRLLIVCLLLAAAIAPLESWGPRGHRLVAEIAAARLTPEARRHVQSLLGGQTMADVARWADDHAAGNRQTAPWHYVNLPLDAVRYDRDRDCPRPRGAARGSVADGWRDCVVDRVLSSRDRLADSRLDRASRATALRFLVHLVGDLHQPFHAVQIARGGNDIPVVVFGSAVCGIGRSAQPCDLHGVWDSELIARRRLSDARYLAELTRQIAARRLDQRRMGAPADWAMESLAVAKAARLPARGRVDDAYLRAQSAAVDERLAMGGLRLAAMLNEALTGPPR